MYNLPCTQPATELRNKTFANVNNPVNKLFTYVYNNIYNALYKDITTINNFYTLSTRAFLFTPFKLSVTLRLTAQIYNLKKRLSSLFVKFFYTIFLSPVKLFNLQLVNRFIFLKNNHYICAKIK